ncbi:cytochrome c biogenesis CcdA family protein [Sulfobacillus thermosulfidooxidans]|uniref:Cytochrome c-type biogenesis protein n=1 Tax=Sulfobacillus thermosulfidooxidans (strain DSM 9293 / VKM B-1269 / AT-1) TaxID=929705 RepID=A0A1W1WG53_SULTA|nr:cytochrome c biogenesis protein CcdA [Sulfobacillus thermosulfidooxidans]OLZ08702.1 cytochrome C biogenesis protein [Sulfobacillus thermosulfidooxidans]OLZ17325.1 cytochrome C biogenesis protein [Sulfobacillus thermosulfidooxidans]OLZ19358.1 cytochrome C biogenesis protein [Sulfobacillus thermosulfidooxidans]SMC05246.1 cytochrome c-type biogenesis protein [Sulfobacillus thermosulfidooxidans DSM 9293]
MDISLVSLGVAFIGGLASVLSPCVLPLIPSYLTTMAGTALTADAIQNHQVRRRVMQNAFLFVLGFSTVLVLAGLGASSLGQFVQFHRHVIAQLGGLITIIFGLEILGFIQIGLIKRDIHLSVTPRAQGLSAVLLGIVFAAGWTPCVGPILTSILLLAARSSTLATGGIMLASYALGLAVPFLALAFFLGQAAQWTRQMGRYLPWIERVSGAMLVILGIMLLTGWYDRIPNIVA